MKIRIEGKYGRKPAWLEWEDGKLTGSDVVLKTLETMDRLLKDKIVEPEPYILDRPDLPDLNRQPYRIYFLCIERCYGLPPVFDPKSAKTTVTDPLENSRPPGAV